MSNLGYAERRQSGHFPAPASFRATHMTVARSGHGKRRIDVVEIQIVEKRRAGNQGREMTEPVERDNMRIEWDVEIVMDDGLILRGDVFRPIAEGKWPVLLTYGPYAKGLAFQKGYPSAWQLMIANHPDVAYGSTNKYQNWEVVDPEKWVPDGYVCVRVDSRGTGRSPGYVDHFSPREPRDF
jgi:predicted acyl esterase